MPDITVTFDNGNGQKFSKNVTVNEEQLVTCSKCGGHVIKEGKKVYKVSRLLIGAPQDIYAQIVVPYCVTCGEEIRVDKPEDGKTVVPHQASM